MWRMTIHHVCELRAHVSIDKDSEITAEMLLLGVGGWN